MLARLLAKAPRLEELMTPVPPGEPFFDGPPHPLRALAVDAGFDGGASFIRRLAASARFPELRELAFTDFRQDHLEDWHEKTTSFEDYAFFLRSPVASRMASIRLREVSLTRAEIRRLLAIRREGVEIEPRNGSPPPRRKGRRRPSRPRDR